jgi:uncharacterized Tic20 family protein
MNQPDLGLKVAELRSQKNLTQEQLAEKCEVSTRTIQRIEGGDVDPRSYTLHCLSEVLDFNFSADDASRENVWLAVLHLSSIFYVLLFIPLLIWSWKKDQSSKIDKQGREVLNFQITMTLLLIMAIIILPVLFTILATLGAAPGFHLGLWEVMIICAPMPLILIGLFCIYQGVTNAMRALTGRPIHYSLAIPFVK